jgi:hypothetical protein
MTDIQVKEIQVMVRKEAVIKVLENKMGPWMIDGKAVRTAYNLPITVQLNWYKKSNLKFCFFLPSKGLLLFCYYWLNCFRFSSTFFCCTYGLYNPSFSARLAISALSLGSGCELTHFIKKNWAPSLILYNRNAEETAFTLYPFFS